VSDNVQEHTHVPVKIDEYKALKKQDEKVRQLERKGGKMTNETNEKLLQNADIILDPKGCYIGDTSSSKKVVFLTNKTQ